jgi:energy-coupling factor transport system ATP-binding protein
MLSQGQQRRLGVAALIAFNCKILICDEPTYAQDRISTLAIMNELVSLVEKQKLLLIISTNDRQLAEDYADVIWNLEGGKLNALT